MLFKRKSEVDLMRDELIRYYGNNYLKKCLELQDDFTNRAVASLSSGATFDESLAKRYAIDAEEKLMVAQQKISHVTDMNDDDVRQLYLVTFGRWHPIGL